MYTDVQFSRDEHCFVLHFLVIFTMLGMLPHDLTLPVAWQVPKLAHEPSTFGQSIKLHEIFPFLSYVEHLSTVPSMQPLICLCLPGPHPNRNGPILITASHAPTSDQFPNTLGQSGRVHGIICSRSVDIHLSTVPSIHVRFCL